MICAETVLSLLLRTLISMFLIVVSIMSSGSCSMLLKPRERTSRLFSPENVPFSKALILLLLKSIFFNGFKWSEQASV